MWEKRNNRMGQNEAQWVEDCVEHRTDINLFILMAGSVRVNNTWNEF